METLTRIAEKAAELFLKNGIKSVTIDDLAAHLSMAKETIYKLFKNKNALVEDFIVKEAAGNINNFTILSKTTNDPIIELFLIMVFTQRLFFRLNPAIIHTLEKDHYQSYLILMQHKERFIFDALKSSIEKGIGLRLYKDDFNVNVMSRFFLESTVVISGHESLKGLDITEHENLLGHVICGIATPTGLEKIHLYKSQHKFTSYLQTLNQPYWED
ncbi:TetR/AcrR family transcriptional regulator [Pedobacter rhodius]|uniref:TetR/AcrR family transcriptional regulator n=1 Tax=Pedobacter rhodius TaxID=3004098 RepID=A0ABT4KX04_9SPHI|nr:TetR/AcrR family transcriptional regulator [Pedobacter sp. SJ11]MCZ4223452.1 TetR/AcrR family transcriptional regulator [Pedobacter sp. SJ11]